MVGFEEKVGREGVVMIVVDKRLGFLRSEDAIAGEIEREMKV